LTVSKVRYPDMVVYGEILTLVSEHTSGRGGPRLWERIRAVQAKQPIPFLADLFVVLEQQRKRIKADRGVAEILAYTRIEGALAMLLATATLNPIEERPTEIESSRA
jgi:hypothetical protein